MLPEHSPWNRFACVMSRSWARSSACIARSIKEATTSECCRSIPPGTDSPARCQDPGHDHRFVSRDRLSQATRCSVRSVDLISSSASRSIGCSSILREVFICGGSRLRHDFIVSQPHPTSVFFAETRYYRVLRILDRYDWGCIFRPIREKGPGSDPP